MKINDVFLKGALTMAVIGVTVALTPANSLVNIVKAAASNTFTAVVLKADTNEAATDSSHIYTLSSKGTIEIDKDNDGQYEIVISAQDMNSLAGYISTLNEKIKTGFDKACANRTKTAKLIEGLGYSSVPTTGANSGFNKAEDTKTSTEKAINALGY